MLILYFPRSPLSHIGTPADGAEGLADVTRSSLSLLFRRRCLDRYRRATGPHAHSPAVESLENAPGPGFSCGKQVLMPPYRLYTPRVQLAQIDHPRRTQSTIWF